MVGRSFRRTNPVAETLLTVIDFASVDERMTASGVLDFYFAPPENWDIVYESGAKGFPTTVIYDANGKEIARLAGEANWNSYEAAALIDAITD